MDQKHLIFRADDHDIDIYSLPLKTHLAVLAATTAFGLLVAIVFVSPLLFFPNVKHILGIIELLLVFLAIPVMFDFMDAIDRRVVAYMAKRYPISALKGASFYRTFITFVKFVTFGTAGAA